MKKTKRRVSLLLACMVAAGAVGGCSNADTAATQAAKETVKEVSKDSGATAATTAAASESAGVPTYKVLIVREAGRPNDFLEAGVMKALEEKHGINIEWDVYENTDWVEQKSLLLASGDLPDAFFGSNALTDADVAQNKSNFIELTDLIDQNMPNLKEVFEKEPVLLARAKNRDGEIYSLVKKLPFRPVVCGDDLYINQKWLDNLGLKAPTNIEELTNVLLAFASEDADGDGDPNNEIPLTGYKNITRLLCSSLRHFGTMVSRAGNYMSIDAQGNPLFMPIQDNYKAAVTWMHEMYEAGVVDPEIFTQENWNVAVKAEGGSKVGLIPGWSIATGTGNNIGEFSVLEAIEGWDGEYYVENASDYLDYSDRELLITTSCENPEKLLQWADDFYTDIIALQAFYGTIGEAIEENGDGTYFIPSTAGWNTSVRDIGPKYMNRDFYDVAVYEETSTDAKKHAADEINAKYVTDDKIRPMPTLKYTDDELATMTTLGTDIYKYVEAQFAHWVVDGGVEEEWDAYIEQLNAMQLDKLLEIQNSAYAAYQESMK